MKTRMLALFSAVLMVMSLGSCTTVQPNPSITAEQTGPSNPAQNESQSEPGYEFPADVEKYHFESLEEYNAFVEKMGLPAHVIPYEKMKEYGSFMSMYFYPMGTDFSYTLTDGAGQTVTYQFSAHNGYQWSGELIPNEEGMDLTASPVGKGSSRRRIGIADYVYIDGKIMCIALNLEKYQLYVDKPAAYTVSKKDTVMARLLDVKSAEEQIRALTQYFEALC